MRGRRRREEEQEEEQEVLLLVVERCGRVLAADRPFLYTLQTCIRAQALLRPHVRFISAVLAGRVQRRDQAGQEATLRLDRRLGRCPCEWQCDCRAALRFRIALLQFRKYVHLRLAAASAMRQPA